MRIAKMGIKVQSWHCQSVGSCSNTLNYFFSDVFAKKLTIWVSDDHILSGGVLVLPEGALKPVGIDGA